MELQNMRGEKKTGKIDKSSSIRTAYTKRRNRTFPVLMTYVQEMLVHTTHSNPINGNRFSQAQTGRLHTIQRTGRLSTCNTAEVLQSCGSLNIEYHVVVILFRCNKRDRLAYVNYIHNRANTKRVT